MMVLSLRESTQNLVETSFFRNSTTGDAHGLFDLEHTPYASMSVVILSICSRSFGETRPVGS